MGPGSGRRPAVPEPVRWAVALLLGGAWTGAVIWLAAGPTPLGPTAGVLVAGGWGLSLLPVHCVPGGRGEEEPLAGAERDVGADAVHGTGAHPADDAGAHPAHGAAAHPADDVAAHPGHEAGAYPSEATGMGWGDGDGGVFGPAGEPGGEACGVCGAYGGCGTCDVSGPSEKQRGGGTGRRRGARSWRWGPGER